MSLIIPPRLMKGDTIGLVSPSWIATEDSYRATFEEIEKFGYKYKIGKNFYSTSWGYAASPEERAADINDMIADDEVKMIFFSGGEGANEVIPLIDYDAAGKHPKIWMSYSDGTSILNAVRQRSGIMVWYGMSPSTLCGISEYNEANFRGHIVDRDLKCHLKSGSWITLTDGKAEGELCGGYLDNFIYLANGGWVNPAPDRDYILFIEEHCQFFCVEHVSDLIARLEHSPIFKQARGLLFGHYSDEPNEYLLQRLTVLGQKWRIPVAYCDDFGHGENKAILPIGIRARFDSAAQTLEYEYPQNMVSGADPD